MISYRCCTLDMIFVTHKVKVSYCPYVSNTSFANSISQIHQSSPLNRKLKNISLCYSTVRSGAVG
jgi:hypothetical protein